MHIIYVIIYVIICIYVCMYMYIRRWREREISKLLQPLKPTELVVPKKNMAIFPTIGKKTLDISRISY